MKRLNRFIFLFLIFSFVGKADSLSVYPGFYYTYGNYSSNASSRSFAGYLPFVFNLKHTFVLGYDNLRINTPDWIYDQQTYNAGTILSFDPVYLKFNYAYLNGDYSEKTTTYSYADKTNILNFETIFRIRLFYLGISYAHLNMDGGILQQSTDQFTGRIEWAVDPRVYLSVKPGYVKIKDGRKLTSVAAKIHYLPVNQVLIKAGGMFGQRAYYFDSDLLTLFNQNETQKKQYFGQFEYSPSSKFRIILSYQHAEFETYSINYYIAGIKTNITF